jgi:type II secretion system protein H
MPRQQSGFTLFEMMIVLVILGLAMSVAPSIMAGLQGSRLRAASDELVWRLRETRNEAIRRGTTTEFVLDLSKRTYANTTGGGVFQIPAVVEAVDVKPAALRQPGGIVRIRFLADGTATAARITLRRGTSSGAIAVDWLTGGVRIDG